MKAVPTIEVLREARANIEAPARWTQYQFARDLIGRPVACESADACCFCLLGSIRRSMARHGLSGFFSDTPNGPQLTAALDVIAKRHGYRYASAANDCGGHAVALAILDDAIAELESKP